MRRVVHQIWIGSAMPEAERGWVDGVRRAATAAGWEHRLWGWEELLKAFGEEPVADVFRRAFALPGEVISPAVVASLACDYYRSRVLAEAGGVYLDTDFECRGPWPDFEELLAAAGVEVLGLEEFFSPVMCAGFFAAADGRAMRLAADAAAEYLLRELPPYAVNFAAKLVAECRRDGGRGGLAQHGVGPGWRRRVALPLWQRAGVRWAFVPRGAVGHRQWGGNSALVHMGAARWHERDGAALSALWRSRAAAARVAEARGTVGAELPPWLRPQSCRALPQVLAGFDPGVDMRTPLWGGHSWAMEARWYAARGFRLLRPRCAARVLVLVCSCHEFVDRCPHFRDAAGQYTQRRAVRSTWMRRLPPGMQSVFFVGEVPHRRISEPKVVQLPCPDDYEHLPRKSREVFRWALENQVFDWVFKCDDDTFVQPERLAALVAGGLDARCLYGGREPKGRNRPSGGAGYLLHRSMLERIVADPAWPDCGAEDVEVARAVSRAGGGIVLDARFNSCPAPAPTVDNELVTAHWLRPSEMRRIYKQCFEL